MSQEEEKSGPDLSFRASLGRLDASGLLLKVADEVDTDLEMTSVLFKQTERAMLFKNVKGYDTRVVGNFLGCEENVPAKIHRRRPGQPAAAAPCR